MIAFSIFFERSRAITPADGGVNPESSKTGTIRAYEFFNLRNAEFTASMRPGHGSQSDCRPPFGHPLGGIPCFRPFPRGPLRAFLCNFSFSNCFRLVLSMGPEIKKNQNLPHFRKSHFYE